MSPYKNLSGLETVNKFTKRMQSITEETKSMIHKAQENMTCYYNRRRLGIPRCIRYQDDISVSEVVISQTRIL